MSLATDILRQHVNLSPKSPKKPSANYLELVERRKAEAKVRIDARSLHMARVPGLVYRNGWEATVYFGRSQRCLGVFETPHRAVISCKLWNYWRSVGFDPVTIPNKPRRS